MIWLIVSLPMWFLGLGCTFVGVTASITMIRSRKAPGDLVLGIILTLLIASSALYIAAKVST